MSKAMTPRPGTREEMFHFLLTRMTVSTNEEACRLTGVTENAVNIWRTRYPEFRELELKCQDATLVQGIVRAQALMGAAFNWLEEILDPALHPADKFNGPVKNKAVELVLRAAGIFHGPPPRLTTPPVQVQNTGDLTIQVLTNVQRPYGQTVEGEYTALPAGGQADES